jgi:inosose dehydratase
MTIRWGVSPIAWSNDDMPELGGDITLDAILTDVREIGFDGVELGNKFPRDPETLAPIMERHALAIVGGWYSTNLLVRDAEAEIAAMARHIDLLAAMGSTVFIAAETSNAVHSDRASRLDAPPRIAADQWEEFGDRLDRIAAHACERGMLFAYHHHLGTVVETAEDLEHFFAWTGEHVGLVLDTGHAIYGGIDPVAIVRSHPDRINHVHCKDVRRGRHAAALAGDRSFLDGVVDGMFTAPGDGDYDYAPFFEALAGIGYSGWVVVEAEQDPALANPRTYSQLGLDTLKAYAAAAGLT